MSQDQDRMLIELHVADMQDQCIVVYYTPAVVPWQILFGRRLVAEKCPLQGYTPQRYATTHRIEYRDILSDVTLGHFLWPAAVAFGLWVGARFPEDPDAEDVRSGTSPNGGALDCQRCLCEERPACQAVISHRAKIDQGRKQAVCVFCRP